MYIPNSYREDDHDILFDLIQQYNFGIIVSDNDGVPYATHVPFLIDTTDHENPKLRTHLARANPHWKMLAESSKVLCIFQGSHDYISPNWYENKISVPTWNYAAIHIYGKPAIIHDADSLRQLVTDLTRTHEYTRNPAWDISNADSIMEKMLQAIVGIEIPIETIEGKYKFSQNKSHTDQQGVAEYFAALPDSNSQAIATIMQTNLKK